MRHRRHQLLHLPVRGMMATKSKRNTSMIACFLILIFARALSSFFSPIPLKDCTIELETAEPLTDDELKAIDFEREQWPQIHEKVCPGGVPNLALEPALFKLGREELEIDLAVFPPPNRKSKPQPIDFYDGIYEVAVYMDGYDENNTLVYPSIWKCANVQVDSYLGLVTNRDLDGEVRDFTSEFGHWNDTIVWQLNTLNKVQAHLADFDRESREEPCVTTVVRDPIDRVLSGYNEVDYRLITGEFLSPVSKKMAKPPYVKIPEYSLNNTKVKAPPEELENRFVTFVRNLVRQHPAITRGNNVYRHLHPMSKILHPLKRFGLLPSGENWFLPLNDYDKFRKEMPIFLAQRCPRMTTIHRPRWRQNQTTNGFPGLPPLPLADQKRSSTDPFGIYEAAKSVLKKEGPAIRALCHVYAPDYACFYSEKEGSSLRARDIPAVCRDVYSSDLFRKTILGSE